MISILAALVLVALLVVERWRQVESAITVDWRDEDWMIG